MSRKGNIFTVVAPSGTGKTTLVAALLKIEPTIQLSVSYTTRAPRIGEIEGKAYHFVSVDTFKNMIAQKELVEYAEVHGHFYGTSRLWLETAQQKGQDILLEIDWQGAAQIKNLFPDAIGIFILPPSLRTLEERLFNRGTDSVDIINRRLHAAQQEIDQIAAFDYVIINEKIDMAVHDLLSIIHASRLTYAQQIKPINAVLQS